MFPLNETEAPRAVPAIRAVGAVQLALHRLAKSPYPGLRRLECRFHEGVLTSARSCLDVSRRQMAWIVHALRRARGRRIC